MNKLKFRGFTKLNNSEMKNILGGNEESIDQNEGDSDDCKSKKDGDPCYLKHNGTTIQGTCRSYMASAWYCSTLL